MGNRGNATRSDHSADKTAAESISVAERFRPWLLCAMTALFVVRPLYPSESAAAHGDGLPVVMLWIGLAIFWLLANVGRRDFIVRFGWIDAAAASLIAWQVVAALWAVWHASPRPAVNMLWEWVALGLSFFIARQLIATEREARAIVAVMIALAVALSAYGLYQYFWEMPDTRAIFEADPDAAIRQAGLSLPPGSLEREMFAKRLYSTEPMSTFALTNSLAGYLTPWLVVLAGIAAGSYANRTRFVRPAICSLLIVGCLILTKSRSAYIAVAVGLALVWLLDRRRKNRIGWKMPVAIVFVAAICVAAAATIGGLDREVLQEAPKSLGYRLQYWQSTLEMIADHPIIGCGPGNFQNAYLAYKLPEAAEEVADPHNFLLEVWATAGTPAAIALLAVLVFLGWKVAGIRRQGTEVRDQPPAPSLSADGWHFVLVGGAAGFLLSVPIGLLGAAPPGPMAVLLGLPLAAVTVALMFDWIRNDRLFPWLPAVGVAALLVNLSAAGGIAFPGVAGTFWLLLALGIQCEPPRTVRNLLAWALLALGAFVWLACYRTGYDPVLSCQAELRMADRNPERAAEHLNAAAAADKYSAEPWRRLTLLDFDGWRRDSRQESFSRFERALAKALELAPNSASARLAAGDLYMLAWSEHDRYGAPLKDNIIAKAVEAYSQAARLYPNSAYYRMKLAEANLSAGDVPAFRREAEAALKLDESTPHNDRKLPAQMRDRLLGELRQDK